LRNPMNQAELVAQADLEENEALGEYGPEVREEVPIPGVGGLAGKSRRDIAEVLTNIMLSRRYVTGIEWKRDRNYVVLFYLKE